MLCYFLHMYIPHPWEQEYRDPQFITLATEPLRDVRDFMKWVKKFIKRENVEHAEDVSRDLTQWTVLDLGCGNGKNLHYIVEYFCNNGIGYDISKTAISYALDLRGELPIDYSVQNIGADYPLADASIDMIVDTTSSHALSQDERGKFLSEISRVLKPRGLYLLRTLCLEGDTNAKNMIRDFPSTEPNTYILPNTDMIERVFTKTDIENDFGNNFIIHYMKKTSGYQKWGNQSYKRNYWVVYLERK